jgi:hypothetical protein
VPFGPDRRRIWVGKAREWKVLTQQGPGGTPTYRKVGPAVRIRFAPAQSQVQTRYRSSFSGWDMSIALSISRESNSLGWPPRRSNPMAVAEARNLLSPVYAFKFCPLRTIQYI